MESYAVSTAPFPSSIAGGFLLIFECMFVVIRCELYFNIDERQRSMCLRWQIYAQSGKTETDKTQTGTVTGSILPLRVQEYVCAATHERCEVVYVACQVSCEGVSRHPSYHVAR